MSEEILRIRIGELKVVRVKHRDGTVSEVPVEKLEAWAEKAHRRKELHESTAKAIGELGGILQELASADSDVEVEFAIPVKEQD